MQQFKELVNHIRDTGVDRGDRTGTGTRSVFGHQMRFDLADSFPLVTGKKTVLRSILHELLWFLQGSTNIKYLTDNDVHIWDEWADPDGNLGPVYGRQWRSWPSLYVENGDIVNGTQFISNGWVESIDQIANVIKMIRDNPEGRRHIVSAWNPVEIDGMALPPCHCLFQFYCSPLTDDERVKAWYAMDNELLPKHLPDYDAHGLPKYKLSCQLYQRSCDVFLGVPFNIASYALLTMMIAKVCNMVPAEFIWTGGDCHLYDNHKEQVEKYVNAPLFDLPTMKINGDQKEIDDFKFEDFELIGYEHSPFIKAPIAV